MNEPGVVLDASAMVDLLIGGPAADAVRARLTDTAVHVPAPFEAECLSALARLTRAHHLTVTQTTAHLDRLVAMPCTRHDTTPLVLGAWQRRGSMRVVDALYVELGLRLDIPVVTTDAGMAAAAPNAELIRPD